MCGSKTRLIRKTFTYILIELMPLDAVIAAGFQTRSYHFQTFQVARQFRAPIAAEEAKEAREPPVKRRQFASAVSCQCSLSRLPLSTQSCTCELGWGLRLR